jgi:hypothetical protein
VVGWRRDRSGDRLRSGFALKSWNGRPPVHYIDNGESTNEAGSGQVGSAAVTSRLVFASDWASLHKKLGSASRSALMSCHFCACGLCEGRGWRGMRRSDSRAILLLRPNSVPASALARLSDVARMFRRRFLATLGFLEAC